MATLKQRKMLAAKAKAVGFELDWDSTRYLENGQVDEMLAKIAEHESGSGRHQQVQPDVEINVDDKGDVSVQQKQAYNIGPAQRSVNAQRFGMCFKLVVHEYGISTAWSMRSSIIGKVKKLYALAELAEECVACKEVPETVAKKQSKVEVTEPAEQSAGPKPGFEDELYEARMDKIAEQAEVTENAN